MAKTWERLIPLIPLVVLLWVWASPLAFVPVPWPDDSAFYFVAKELFKWPPRWVMLPQAPFEPTYAIHNFNTMPLFPILIGLGRAVGIDGSFAIKVWSLGFWAGSGSLLTYVLLRAGLPALAAALVALAFSLDPAMRWASVIVRPESLIGACGVAITLGVTLGFPKRFAPRKLWDPVSALLAIAAYSHFNAIHLLAPVIVAYATDWRRLRDIAWKTALYLVPWVVTVLLQPRLFVHQMTLQWQRLAVGNGWLDSVKNAIGGIFQELGSPEPWPESIKYGAMLIWGMIFFALIRGLVYPAARRRFDPLMPSAAWLVSGMWIWHSKPEVWFTYYMHVALWTFVGLAALELLRHRERVEAALLFGLLLPATVVFGMVDVQQTISLGRGTSWKWSTFDAWVDCIDSELVKLEKDLGNPVPFRVWAPTWPDMTIELSRRHPHWELTRTNDFNDRNHLAIRHAHDVEAVVVAETLNWEEEDRSEPMGPPQSVRSLWLNWKDYYIYQLWSDPSWKPSRRYYCQRGRWQAFLFMKAPGDSK